MTEPVLRPLLLVDAVTRPSGVLLAARLASLSSSCAPPAGRAHPRSRDAVAAHHSEFHAAFPGGYRLRRLVGLRWVGTRRARQVAVSW